jgi:AIPR protein
LLQRYVKEQLSQATVNFEFWGCQRLLAEARRSPTTTETLEISKQFTANDGSAVCLVKLGSLAALLRDEHGNIRRSMLEPNVRDYQGPNITVNRSIRATLETKDSPEFWWLNNGVTILATECSVVGDRLIVKRPEVVNGLQTSYEIFNFFKDNPERPDNRNVLIRVIVPPDNQIKNKIIRATNLQTPISEISLHATDQIHFDIEEKFRLYQLYYERRKGEYRELRRPVDRIISMQTLARAVIAILLQQPNNAYATPTRVLKNEENYGQVFSEEYNRDLYLVCIMIQRQVDAYVAEYRQALKGTRSFIRYYVSMMVAIELLRNVAPAARELAALLPLVTKPVDSGLIESSCAAALAVYERFGATETIAKGREMREEILRQFAAKFSSQQSSQTA